MFSSYEEQFNSNKKTRRKILTPKSQRSNYYKKPAIQKTKKERKQSSATKKIAE